MYMAHEVAFSVTLRICGLVFVVLASIAVASGDPGQSFVVCRDSLSIENRARLETELRQITGLQDLKFDSEGALRFDPRVVSGGSVHARQLLTHAINGPTAIVIEDASRRADVVFARVIPGKWKHQAGNLPEAFVVLIDFADFEFLTGDEAALESFNAGWALLHELDHAVEDSEDADALHQPGDCEEHLNQMRSECGLPLRVEYFHTLFPVSASSDFKTRIVRLHFVKALSRTGEKKHYWLLWDAAAVGCLDGRVASSR
ncbi:MAG TPA: hypothetical protein VIV66_22820 [Pyrinomonadaceae bacterium]